MLHLFWIHPVLDRLDCLSVFLSVFHSVLLSHSVFLSKLLSKLHAHFRVVCLEVYREIDFGMGLGEEVTRQRGKGAEIQILRLVLMLLLAR